MPLNIEQKKEVVKELNVFANESVSGAIAEYSGLSVQDLTLLRNKARESDVYLKVVKNTLSKRAFEETDFKCLVDDLNGNYAIGHNRPIQATATVDGKQISLAKYDYKLAPNSIISFLDLRKPIFAGTATWGHMGRGFNWN